VNNNELVILGCGSAKPTKTHTPTAQVVQIRDKQFLIDCGEGAQIQMARMSLRTPRLNHIFISHLHGDHCFGLLGLISTWGMQGRTNDLFIHAHRDLEKLLQPLLDYFCQDIPFLVRFEPIDPYKHEIIYDDKSLSVTTLPLKHKVPCCGFLFKEKEGERHIRREMIDDYQIPLSQILLIKQGADYQLPDGRILKNDQLTTPPTHPVSYAYCSDTAYSEKIVDWIEGVDLLYHEATYTNEFQSSAHDRMHSTAANAATIAQMAHVGQLLIGHYSARLDNYETLLSEAQAIFPHTCLAEEFKTYSIKK